MHIYIDHLVSVLSLDPESNDTNLSYLHSSRAIWIHTLTHTQEQKNTHALTCALTHTHTHTRTHLHLHKIRARTYVPLGFNHHN